ncbi:MAG TPA: SCO family protein [Burkholderiales bacterium]
MSGSIEASRRRRGRWVIVALAALFFAGFIVAFVLVQSGWRPSATKNYGELVQPPRPLHAADGLTDLAGAAADAGLFQGKWTFVYFGPAACGEVCRDNLYKMRQVTLAQGTEAYRVQRVFVLTDARELEGLRALLAAHPGLRVLHGPDAAVRALAAQFALPGANPLDGSNRLYLVDPLGNLMMSYPAGADPRGINKDLKLLLRASQVG